MAQDLGLRVKVSTTEADNKLLEFLKKWEKQPINLDISLNDAGLNAASAKIQKLKQEALNAQKAIKKGVGSASGAGAAAGATSNESALSKQIKAQQKAAQTLDRVWLNLEKRKNSLQKSLNTVQNGPQLPTNKVRDYQNQINSLMAQMKQVEDLRNAIQKKTANGQSSSALLGDVDRIKLNSADKLQSAQNSIEYLKGLSADFKAVQKEFESAQKAIKKGDNQIIAFDKIGNRLTEYWGKYGAQLQKNIPILEKYQTLVNRVNSRDFGSASELNQAFAQFRMEARQAGIEVESFGSKLERTFGSRVRSAMAGYGVFAMQSAMQDIIQNSINFDKAFTELKKVTSATSSEYVQFVDDAKSRAVDLKTSLTDVTEATASFARLGYNIPMAETLANTAIIYKDVGDGLESIDEASSSIISTMQGFNISASDSLSIVDKFNEVGNRFATTSGDIGEGLRRSAAAMSAGNNDLDESIALFTAGQTVLQDAASMGTILKTTSMRLRGASTDEMEAAGVEVDDFAGSVSKLRDEILSLTGVDIQLNDDTFKSTYQILTEISDVWDQLSDISQANVLELLAGKRNANALAAIIKNGDLAREVYEVSANSAGSAEKEFETWSNSVEGHIGEFQAKWESLSTSLADSTGLKMLIDLGGTAISVLDKLTGIFGGVTMAVLPFVGALSKVGNIGRQKYALLCGTHMHRMLAA